MVPLFLFTLLSYLLMYTPDKNKELGVKSQRARLKIGFSTKQETHCRLEWLIKEVRTRRNTSIIVTSLAIAAC